MGRLSRDQSDHLVCLEDNGYKYLVSNNCDEVLEEIIEYIKGVRFFCKTIKMYGFISHCSLHAHRSGFYKERLHPSHGRSYLREDLLTSPIGKPSSLDFIWMQLMSGSSVPTPNS